MRLFIDGRNVLYRAVYANKQNSVHDITIVMRMMMKWIKNFNPNEIHVFWDSSGPSWRSKILKEYKEHRGDMHVEVRARINTLLPILKELFDNLGIYQYEVKDMEADDLVYAACSLFGNEITIVSSDSDYAQLSFRFKNVKVYNPNKDSFISSEYNPVIIKALIGDKTDNIEGYRGIGPVKGTKLAADYKSLIKFLDDNGWNPYLRNVGLIDLSICPYTLNNIKIIQINYGTFESKIVKNVVNEIIIKHKLVGLIEELSHLFHIFENVQVEQ